MTKVSDDARNLIHERLEKLGKVEDYLNRKHETWWYSAFPILVSKTIENDGLEMGSEYVRACLNLFGQDIQIFEDEA